MTRPILAAVALLLALTGCATTTESHAPQADPARVTAPADQPDATTGQSQAAAAAEGYIEIMPMSAKAVRDQLVFDKHKRTDIEWVMKHLDVDWDAEAVESAELYLSTDTGISREGLIDQLVFEGFTKPQAQHGAKVAWNNR